MFPFHEIKQRQEKMVTGLDFFENLNTLDDPHSTDSLNKLAE